MFEIALKTVFTVSVVPRDSPFFPVWQLLQCHWKPTPDTTNRSFYLVVFIVEKMVGAGTVSTPKCYCLIFSTISDQNSRFWPLSGTTSIPDLFIWGSETPRDVAQFGDRINAGPSHQADRAEPYKVLFVGDTKSTTCNGCNGCKGRVRQKAFDPPPHLIHLRISRTPSQSSTIHCMRSCAPTASRESIEIGEEVRGQTNNFSSANLAFCSSSVLKWYFPTIVHVTRYPPPVTRHPLPVTRYPRKRPADTKVATKLSDSFKKYQPESQILQPLHLIFQRN